MPVLRFIFILCLLAFFHLRPAAAEPVIRMLMPGFTVEELPIDLSNQNNLRFAPDGSLTSLGYDGRIWRLRDTNGDGLEDVAEPFWDKPTLSVPLGICWSTRGLYVSSKGKISLLRDTDGDGRADLEEVIASGWPSTDVGSGGVDATAVTLDAEGNLYFGLLVADYSNAYRLRKRKDLKPDEVAWLKDQGRWREPSSPNAAEDEFSLYDLASRRGTIQKWDARTRQLTNIATGIRVPVALAFNRAGDLFNTDQEGETWMPNGNPLDELNHIVPGRNYGFPPTDGKWLTGFESERPVAEFGPQHQSACGFLFNGRRPALRPSATESETALPVAPPQGLFGPTAWRGDALVAGESRGKIWRVHLAKTANGYVSQIQTIARLSMLTLDLAISPRGDLYVACHSGTPDWGTGPKGPGKIFRIRHTDPFAPVPLIATPTSPTEVRIAFDKPLDSTVPRAVLSPDSTIEFGEYVTAGDRFELLKPPYVVVKQQDAAPRGRLAIRSARLEDQNRSLVLTTDPHPLAVRYAVTLPGIKAADQNGSGATIDIDYDLTRRSQPLPANLANVTSEALAQLVPWAPKARASAGTDSRAPDKPDGDWEHGRQLFLKDLQCGKCHRVRGAGGTAGPDLSNLLFRDLNSVLRDIREPSATIHPDYITYQVALKDGEVVQGFVRSQTEDAIHLFDVEGKETVLPRANIQSFRPTELSLMPAGLLDGRKETDLRDLLTFLLWVPPQRDDKMLAALADQVDKEQRSEAAGAQRNLHIVLVASKQDHGEGQHDYPHWQTNWTRLLSRPELAAHVETAWQWPSAAQFESADVVVFYYWNHDWSAERYAQVDSFLARGGGIALIHSSVIADQDPERLAQRMGLSAQPGRSGYRHMPFQLHLVDRKHPITRIFPEHIEMLDEPYWPLIGDPKDVQVLATAKVDGEEQPLIWVKEQGKGRVFASIPGHYTWSFEDPVFSRLLLRGIAWAAHQPVNRFNAIRNANLDLSSPAR